MESLGFRVAAVVKEELNASQLNSEFWDGAIFLDKELAWFKYVGGGEIYKGDLARRNEPDVNAHREHAKATYGGNLEGEGLIMGGSVVVSKEGNVSFMFLEDNFGKFADLDNDVMPLLRELAGK